MKLELKLTSILICHKNLQNAIILEKLIKLQEISRYAFQNETQFLQESKHSCFNNRQLDLTGRDSKKSQVQTKKKPIYFQSELF